MKKDFFIRLIILLLGFFILSCSKDDSSTNTPKDDNNNNNNNQNQNVPPQPPAGIVLTPGDAMITVRWDIVANLKYNLYYQTGFSVTKASGIKISDVVSPYTLNSLSNDSAYSVILTAENNYGESELSQVYSATPLSFIVGQWWGKTTDTSDRTNYYELDLILTLSKNKITGTGTVKRWGSNSIVTENITVNGTYNSPNIALGFTGSAMAVSFAGIKAITGVFFSGTLTTFSGNQQLTLNKIN